MLKISQLLDQHSLDQISKNKDQFYFIFERWRQALHFPSRTSFHHSSGNIHIPRYRFSFYPLWIIDLKPNYHNRQNVDQLLKRNCPIISFSNLDVMLGYIYPYYKTYKHWLNPHNCASKTASTLLDICEWLCNHTLVYFPYDFFKPNVDVHLKSNNELLHFRTLTSYHIFPFLKQS